MSFNLPKTLGFWTHVKQVFVQTVILQGLEDLNYPIFRVFFANQLHKAFYKVCSKKLK